MECQRRPAIGTTQELTEYAGGETKVHERILLPYFLPVRNLSLISSAYSENFPIQFYKSQCAMYVLCMFPQHTVTFTVNCKEECEPAIVLKMSVYVCKLFSF